jgi:hypothetical protein
MWPNLRHCPATSLEKMGKTSQDNECPERDSNEAPPEHNPETVPLKPTCSVKFKWENNKPIHKFHIIAFWVTPCSLTKGHTMTERDRVAAAVLTREMILRGLPQSLRRNSGIVPRLAYHRFLSNPFPFIYSATTLLGTESIVQQPIERECSSQDSGKGFRESFCRFPTLLITNEQK